MPNPSGHPRARQPAPPGEPPSRSTGPARPVHLPRHRHLGLRRRHAIGPFEGATVKVDLGGRVLVATGAVNSGQGHETSFAQVCADALGVPLST